MVNLVCQFDRIESHLENWYCTSGCVWEAGCRDGWNMDQGPEGEGVRLNMNGTLLGRDAYMEQKLEGETSVCKINS